MSIAKFVGSVPECLPEVFFNGRCEGWGVLESLVGGFQKRGTITAQGKWDPVASAISLQETYSFDDGFEDTLRWTIFKRATGLYDDEEPRLDGKAGGGQEERRWVVDRLGVASLIARQLGSPSLI